MEVNESWLWSLAQEIVPPNSGTKTKSLECNSSSVFPSLDN